MDEPSLYVPGSHVCPKCGFILQLNTLHVQSGTCGPDTTVADRACPNDGHLMGPETWEHRARNIATMAEQYLARAVKAEEQVEALEKLLTQNPS